MTIPKLTKSSEIKKLRHENYKNALFGTTKEEKSQSVSANFIRHEDHQLYSQTITKTGICGFDDKRFVLSDNIHTLSHGHYEIPKIIKKHQKEEERKKEAEKLKALEKETEEESKSAEVPSTEEVNIVLPNNNCDKCGKIDKSIDNEKEDAFSVLKVCDEKLLCEECI